MVRLNGTRCPRRCIIDCEQRMAPGRMKWKTNHCHVRACLRREVAMANGIADMSIPASDSRTSYGERRPYATMGMGSSGMSGTFWNVHSWSPPAADIKQTVEMAFLLESSCPFLLSHHTPLTLRTSPSMRPQATLKTSSEIARSQACA